MKLGSLFDGIGGFPLAATMLGIEPVWASEIEKFPIAVTKERFPSMKHLGSVCDIKGAEVEPVDIITFGSPCQDLSVAGKRAGMGEGTRSGLFSEAVRIIKEMRDANIWVERRSNSEMGNGGCPVNTESTGGLCGNLRNTNDVGSKYGTGDNAAIESASTQHGIYSNNGGKNERCPRYAIWENVPGAYSSNGGEDFRAVVESLAKVAEETVSIPLPQDGKWEPAGLVEGDGWSIAWRTLDAQFWGVPQRRRRIFLVADFGGDRASEIFFERESVSGNTAKSGGSGQEATGGVEGSVRATGIDGNNALKTWIEYDQFTRWDSEQFPECNNNEYLNYKNVDGTICSYGYRRCYDVGNDTTRFQWIKRENALRELKRLKGNVAGFKGNQGAKAYGIGYAEEQSPTLGAEAATPTICLHATQDPITAEDRSHALGANSSQAVYRFQRTDAFVEDSKGSPLAARDCKDGRDLVIANCLKAKANLSHREDSDTYAIQNQSVRRLTPRECEALQGFPLGWTDIPGASDSTRYKALGNSVAIPCVKFILSCIRRTF